MNKREGEREREREGGRGREREWQGERVRNLHKQDRFVSIPHVHVQVYYVECASKTLRGPTPEQTQKTYNFSTFLIKVSTSKAAYTYNVPIRTSYIHTFTVGRGCMTIIHAWRDTTIWLQRKTTQLCGD